MKYAFFVTSSIACGKSTFLKIANSNGYKSISADSIAHEILEQNHDELMDIFNSKDIIKDNKINRKFIANLIFNDKNLKKRLEEFIHPKIKEEILKKSNELDDFKKIYFIEIPLLFETKNYENLAKIILIYSTKELMLERLIKRDNLNKEEALKRINSQIDIEKKIKLADFVIKNLNTYENFQQECVRFLKRLNEKV